MAGHCQIVEAGGASCCCCCSPSLAFCCCRSAGWAPVQAPYWPPRIQHNILRLCLAQAAGTAAIRCRWQAAARGRGAGGAKQRQHRLLAVVMRAGEAQGWGLRVEGAVAGPVPAQKRRSAVGKVQGAGWAAGGGGLAADIASACDTTATACPAIYLGASNSQFKKQCALGRPPAVEKRHGRDRDTDVQ